MLADTPARRSGELTDLVRRAAAGDEQAWTTITDRFEALVWSMARRHGLGTADAGDVAQTTWLRLVENLGRIREPERLAGWLATTARNESLHLLKRSGREAPSRTGEDVDQPTDPDLEPLDLRLLTDERDAILWRTFEQLSASCRRLLRVLMATDTSSYQEVARALDMPIGSIGPTRMRCLERLRRLLSDTDYPFDRWGAPA